MTPERGNRAAASAVTALAERFRLAGGVGEQLLTLVECVVEDPAAPTGVREPLSVVERHLADSLVALELGVLPEGGKVVDIGSGAGFPGLPLAAALPQLRFFLLESNARKCRFIERAAARCGLENVIPVNARAETWPGGLRRFDLALARALAPLEVVVEYAAPLITVGGTLIAWRGRRDPAAEAAAARAAAEVGLAVGRIVQVQPFVGATDRHLHLMSKVRETPTRFPRRPGVALKRPLGRAPGGPVPAA